LLVLAAATILLPSWLSEFLGALGKYTDYIQIGPPLQVWAEMLSPSDLSAVFTGIGVLVLAVAFLWKWARSITGTWHAYMPTIEFAMLFTTLAMLRTATTDQSMLLLLWISWFSTLFRTRPALAFASATLILLVPWLIFLATLTGNQEAPIATTSAVGLTLAGYLVFETKILRSRLLPEKPLDPASAHVAL
jgi:hypothetical protein